jgi:hypothetical protein
MNATASILLTFLGPIPILILFLRRFQNQLSRLQRLAIGVIIYVLSLATALFTTTGLTLDHDTENIAIGLVGGVIAPLIYCSLFALFTRSHMHTQVGKIPIRWNPIVVRYRLLIIAVEMLTLVSLVVHRFFGPRIREDWSRALRYEGSGGWLPSAGSTPEPSAWLYAAMLLIATLCVCQFVGQFGLFLFWRFGRSLALASTLLRVLVVSLCGLVIAFPLEFTIHRPFAPL